MKTKTTKKSAKKTAPRKTAKKKTAKRKTPAKKSSSRRAVKKTSAPRKLLLAAEPLPFRIENASGAAQALVLCDHASFRVPRALKDMGLKKNVLKRHIGWDIGAEDAALHIARAFGAPAVIAQYSRLVVDLNRGPHYRECMPETSDHVKIPANADLNKKDREQRLAEIYRPYHKAAARVIDRQIAAKRPPLILSIHSMTPRMDGVSRPWHMSLLWNREAKLARCVAQALRRARPDILVGENEPYTLTGERFVGSTIWRHTEERGLPYLLVEFRQDLVDTRQKAAAWAEVFIKAVRPVLDDPETFAGRKIKPKGK